ncbi:MAG: hypothetical protein JWP81_4166 [Ferruginibacter sp.]|nr:hypothetical protein [Ferruginibacter sp.]
MTATMFIEQQYPVRKILKYAGLSPSSYYFEKATGTPKTYWKVKDNLYLQHSTKKYLLSGGVFFPLGLANLVLLLPSRLFLMFVQ